MNIEVTVQYATRKPYAPHARTIRDWAQAVLSDRDNTCVTVRIVDEQEGRQLNSRWRGKQHATNVLAFAGAGSGGVLPERLGDIVICAPVVAHEATTQDKDIRAHWAHMVVHGILHLLGFDHQAAADARAMEQREINILRGFGYPDPYSA